jgi:hypothetical protein
MRKVSEYKAHAEECRKLAAGKKNQAQKNQLESLAAAWDMLASQLQTARAMDRPTKLTLINLSSVSDC